jgi:hypothetical protein
VTLEEVQARMEIELTIARYITASDEGRLDDFAATFAEDGVLAPPGVPECRGRPAIREFIAASRASRLTLPGLGEIRHHVARATVELTLPAEGRATSYFMAVSANGPDHWGIYSDELVPVGGAWLFRRRTVLLHGADPAGWIGSGAGVAKLPGRAA